MFTDFEKTLYNEHLKESRKAKNLPYRPRKNFEKVSETTKLCLKKLAMLFLNNKEISPSNFFKAPYSIYSEDEFFDLKFYTTQKAIKVYKIYIESQKEIDSQEKPASIPSSDESHLTKLN